ncbi:reticulocyte binding protein 2 homolog b, partial [Eurytemora carolleeae]|uniref:reticulocyte binding protein 2 homolog b n=1 Tax=Eurytemora carolleeae TaxID=1294199 RepID=UPI000C77898C
MRLMKLFLCDNKSKDEVTNDLGLSMASFCKTLKEEPVCMDEIYSSRDREVVKAGVMSNWTKTIPSKSMRSMQSGKVIYPFCCSTNKDYEELSRQLKAGPSLMDKILFLHVGEQPLEEENKLSKLQNLILELRKFKPVLSMFALKAREDIRSGVDDERLSSNNRLSKWICRFMYFYKLMKEEVNQIKTDVRLGMFEDLEEDCQENKDVDVKLCVWMHNIGYECLLVEGLNIKAKKKTIRDLLVMLTNLPHEDFIELRRYINKGPKRFQTSIPSIRLVETECLGASPFKHFKKVITELPLTRWSNLKIYSRKNNRVIDYNDIYKREWLALYKRVLETAAEIGYTSEDCQGWEEGDPDGDADPEMVYGDDNGFQIEEERVEEERLENEGVEKKGVDNRGVQKKRVEKKRVAKEGVQKKGVEKRRVQKKGVEKEIMEKEKVDNERVEKETMEKDTVEKETVEMENVEKETMEMENVEKERMEKERVENKTVELDNVEKERMEKESVEKETVEMETVEMETLEIENVEKERMEKETMEMETMEKERMEKMEMERIEKEKIEKEKIENERME